MLRRCVWSCRMLLLHVVDPCSNDSIGTCRKKVMGLLRLMGNKADVVKGLAKRCNENWRVAPTSDIVRFFERTNHRALLSDVLYRACIYLTYKII